MEKIKFEETVSILKNLGYEKPTRLQTLAWQDMNYKGGAREFIIGSTSSGKTLVPIVSYLLDRIGSKMIYIVPFRALATQKIDELKKICQQFELDILVSTSEYCASDVDIKFGNCDVAIIIYEKVFAFLAEHEDFFTKYDYVVMDEIGLVEDVERGLKADYVLHKACSTKSSNVYVLATPFYNWNLYINNYGFHAIRENETERPITINRNEVRYDYLPLPQSDGTMKYPYDIHVYRKMLKDICIEELSKGRKVLVFNKTRKGVENIARNLFYDLSKSAVLPESNLSVEEIKQRAIKKMQMNELDIQGIYDNHDYLAYSYGIAYHHSALPEEARNMVENDFLEDDGMLKVVISTNTLAYGINSNVDTVIVTDLQTYDNDGTAKGNKVTNRFLHPNEYMNYIGRAGRLGRRDHGYSYTFIKNPSENDMWKNLMEEIENPPTIRSQYSILGKDMLSSKIGQNIPLCVLNCMPRNLGEGISFEELLEKMSSFSDCKKTELLRNNIAKILKNLEKRRLILKGFDDEEEVDVYKLTALGLSIGGSIFPLRVLDELVKFSDSLTLYEKPFDLIYKLCQIGDIKVIGGNQSDIYVFSTKASKLLSLFLQNGYISKQLEENIRKNFKGVFQELKYIRKFCQHKKNKSDYMRKNMSEHDWNSAVSLMKAVSLFLWSSSVPIEDIGKLTNMPYGDIKRLGEKGKYYTDALHNIMKLKPGEEELCKYLVKLGASLYYGVHVDLLEKEDILKLEPTRARVLRNNGIKMEFVNYND